MAGFCRIMKEEQNSQNQKFMLDYLISLRDDANDFTGNHQRTASLMTKANHRLHQAFRPSTSAAYNNMFRFFFAFCIFAQIPFSHVTTNQVLLFMEFLVFNNVSNLSINSYLSALKAKFIIHDFDTGCFHNHRTK